MLPHEEGMCVLAPVTHSRWCAPLPGGSRVQVRKPACMKIEAGLCSKASRSWPLSHRNTMSTAKRPSSGVTGHWPSNPLRCSPAGGHAAPKACAPAALARAELPRPLVPSV